MADRSRRRLFRVAAGAVLRLGALLVAAGALSVGGCGRAESTAPPPAGSIDPAHPARIVALSPAVAVMLRDMGLESWIVGRHGFDLVLDPAVPVCGDQAGIKYEALLRVRPTHVFTQWGSRELPARLTDLAARHGWRVLDVRLLALDDVPAGVDAMAAALPEDASPAARALAARLRDAFSPREPAASPPVFAGRVLLLVSTRSLSALGPGSFHQELLVRMGGVPALDAGNPFVELSAEDVARLAPDGIVLFAPRPPARTGTNPAMSSRTPEFPMGSLEGLNLPATRSGRLAVIDHPLGLLPGSSLEEVARALRAILEGWHTPADAATGPLPPSLPSTP